jgi:putative peptidoglycan lipid II flippase
MQFPIGVFGVAIATVTLPAVSILKARNDLKAFGEALEHALRLTFFLTFPAAAGLAILAQPIIQIIYEHGRFTETDTQATALALQAYALGLVGYSAIKVLTPCFYALGEAKAPLRVSLMGMGVNIVLNALFFYILGWGHAGLALSTSLLALINFAQLLIMIRRHVSIGCLKTWLPFILSLFSSTAFMVTLATVILYLWPTPNSFAHQILRLCSIITCSSFFFALCSWMLRIGEIHAIIRLLRRKASKGLMAK